MKYSIKNRYTCKIITTQEIECDDDTPESLKLGMAIIDAVKEGVNLRDANIRGAKNIPSYVFSVTNILPEGEIVGWKKLRKNLIAKLIIPKDAKRCNATGRKCRCEYAIVDSIYDGKNEVNEGYSRHDGSFKYMVGETVKPDKFDDDRWNECSNGIHFFITRYEAEQY